MFVAIGVSIGTAQISTESRDRGSPAIRTQTIGGEIALALCGAEIVLRTGDTTERSILQFPFVPHGARRVAWGMFTTDPARAALQARVLGYREP